MPLQKALAAVPLAGGLDTKTDKFQIAAGNFAVLENAVFTRAKRLSKRNGFSKLPRSVTEGRALTSYLDELVLFDPTSLSSYDKATQQFVRKGSVSSLAVSSRSLVKTGGEQTAQDGAVHPSGLACYAWEDSSGGIRYSVVDRNTGQPRFIRALSATGIKPKTLVVQDVFAIYYVDLASPTLPVLMLAVVPVATPGAAPSFSVLTSDVPSGANQLSTTAPSFDVSVAPGPNQVYLAFNNASSGTSLYWFQVLFLTEPSTIVSWSGVADLINVFTDAVGPVVLSYHALVVSFHAYKAFPVGSIPAPVLSSVVAAGGGTLVAGTYSYRISALDASGNETAACLKMKVTTGSTGSVIVTWGAVTGAVSYNVYGRDAGAEQLLTNTASVTFTDDGTDIPAPPFAPNFPSPVVAQTGTVQSSVANVVSLTGVAVDDAPAWQVFYGVSGAAPSKALTRTCTVAAYVAGTSSVLLRSVAPIGKAFLANGTACVPLVHESTDQSTYFLSDAAGNLVGKFLYGDGGGLPFAPDAITNYGMPNLAETCATSASAWTSTFLETSSLTTTGGAVKTQTGISSFDWDFADPTESYLRAELGNTLQVGGGFVSMYDGLNVCELGFHLWPEDTTASPRSDNPGLLSAGQYQYVVCYEWTDNRGQIHRSAPSVPVTITATALQSAELIIPTLRLTAKSGVLIQVYRTAVTSGVAGTEFFLANATTVPSGTGGVNAPLTNDPTVDTMTWFDRTVSDDTLLGNPILYTTGGVVDNVPPNAVTAMTVFQNRCWAVDTDGVLWYSKQVIPGAPVEFSDAFTFNVDPRGGPITAIGAMGSVLAIFKRGAIFLLAGNGPGSAPTGADSYPDATLQNTDAGCINPRSVAVVPQGLVFQSAKGIYLLGLDGTVSYIGALVEAYNGETVTSAVLAPTTNQIRFTLAPSATLPAGAILMFDYLVGLWATWPGCGAVDSTIWEDTHCYLQADGTVRQETPGVFTDAGEPIKLRLQTAPLQLNGLQGYKRVWEFLILGEYQSPHQLKVSVARNHAPAPSQVELISPTAPNFWGTDSVWGGDPFVPTDTTVWGGDFQAYQWRVYVKDGLVDSLQITIEDLPCGAAGEGMSLSALTFVYGIKGRAQPLGAGRSVG